MAEPQESRWIDLSTEDDKLARRQRLVKTVSIPGSSGARALRVEVVTERALGVPPEDTFTEWLYDWLEGN
jgi:hypothetical protein